MQLTYDLSRYGIPDGQIVLGGIYNFDTWAPGGPNALSVATLSYYQTFLNKLVELKIGYLANAVEFWGPFLAGNLAASIFGPSATIPVELGINALPGQLRRSTSRSMARTDFTTSSAFNAQATRMVPPSRRLITRPT